MKPQMSLLYPSKTAESLTGILKSCEPVLNRY
jgi:hypothetical protein